MSGEKKRKLQKIFIIMPNQDYILFVGTKTDRKIMKTWLRRTHTKFRTVVIFGTG